MRLQYVSTAANIVVLVAPILDVAVATVALCLSSAEAQALVTVLESGVEVMNDGDNEGLSATTISTG